jgi:hypothetical protein
MVRARCSTRPGHKGLAVAGPRFLNPAKKSAAQRCEVSLRRRPLGIGAGPLEACSSGPPARAGPAGSRQTAAMVAEEGPPRRVASADLKAPGPVDGTPAGGAWARLLHSAAVGPREAGAGGARGLCVGRPGLLWRGPASGHCGRGAGAW